MSAADGQVQTASIIGGGRIGTALQTMGTGQDTLVGRGQAIPENSEGPIYVCTRNDVLEEIINNTPPARRPDLFFIQNGVLGPLLEKHGLGDNSQAQIFFGVPKKGDKPVDGVTDANPEGLTVATGKWAGELAARLKRGDLTCHVLDKQKYTGRMFEKHIWICAFNLIGVKHKCSMGEVDSQHGPEIRGLITELKGALESERGAVFEPAVEDRLCAYARSVSHYPAAIKEFNWRNQYFQDISKQAAKEGRPDPCPTHTQLLNELGLVT